MKRSYPFATTIAPKRSVTSVSWSSKRTAFVVQSFSQMPQGGIFLPSGPTGLSFAASSGERPCSAAWRACASRYAIERQWAASITGLLGIACGKGR